MAVMNITGDVMTDLIGKYLQDTKDLILVHNTETFTGWFHRVYGLPLSITEDGMHLYVNFETDEEMIEFKLTWL